MKRNLKREWIDYYNSVGIPEILREEYAEYIDHMYKRGCPPIFEFRHLAKLLGRTREYLACVINKPECHYRSFEIPKRRGGKRKIEAPYPALLECQKWINTHILCRVKIHRTAHGFAKKKSILSNASIHLSSKALLKIDLKDFFPSIKENRVVNVFTQIGYPHNVSFYLARLCLSGGSLPQGAATSPYLSNIITRKLDLRLFGLARACGLRYTRYADDMTFSGEYISKNEIAAIMKIIQEEGFQVNHDKTRLSLDNRGRKIVTGISVKGDTLKVPKNYKRMLRQEIYYIMKYGFMSHMTSQRIRNPYYPASLYGKLLFWKYVEPENTFVKKYLPQVFHLINM